VKNRPGVTIVAVLIVALFVVVQLFFIVREGEVAILTTLGKPVRAHTEAGLFNRKPWPIQKVHRFDNRLRMLESSFEETLTEDDKNVLVGVYAAWRIHDPIAFLESVGSIREAESNLDGLLRGSKSAVLGTIPFSGLVNTDASALQFDAIETNILAQVQSQALERYGIEVATVGIHRLGLPQGITDSVFERMRSERNKIAERYRSEGEGEAIKIRAAADSEREKLLSRARAQAKRIRADGEAAAADHYEVLNQDPELATFLKKLEALEEMLQEGSKVILTTETSPFDLLRGGDDALPKTQGEGTTP
jgi:membrane protease subunit HflC